MSDGQIGAGIDVGGGKCLGVLVDDTGQVLAESRVRTPNDADQLIETILAIAVELRGIAGHIDGLGVGLPGLVTADGVLRYAPNLVGISDLPVLDLLARELGVPVVVDNDSNCAIWAEYHFGALRGIDDGVLVTLGTGIGTGVLVGGRLERGANGFAGELGHVIVDPQGERCGCGRIGCWETVASGGGLARRARRAASAGLVPGILSMTGGDVENLRGEHVTRAARKGDPGALGIIDEFSRWVAVGLANYATLLDPAKILIGAGLGSQLDLIAEPLRRHFDELVFGAAHRPSIPIEPAALGERAGALGAAELGRAAAR